MSFGDGRIAVEIDAYYPIPKSYSRKRAAEIVENGLAPTKKPDCDNIIKSVLDALNGCAYKDDAQVTDVRCRKHYAAPGEDARVVVGMRSVGNC